jgi:hypothetical protein
MANSIVRVVIDGVEFFSVVETGASGMSVSGLARLCGVSRQQLSYLLNLVAKESAPKRLKALTEEDLWLQTETAKVIGSSKVTRVKILRSKACALLIKHYAFEGNEKAEYALDKFADKGIANWIQSITGWTPKAAETSLYLTGVVLIEPKQWELHFDEEWIAEAVRLTGWLWEWSVMGKFINEAVYDYMPKEVRAELDKYNPRGRSGKRPNKQHQHFSDEAKPVLQSHIREVLTLMKSATSIPEFRELMSRRWTRRYQLSLKVN